MIRLAVAAALGLAGALAAVGADPEPVVVPRGLPPELQSRLDSERALASLGLRLFRDPILSLDRTIACINCHDPGRNFARNEARSKGIRDRETKRNVPTILNRALGTHFMWDGRAASLEEQVLLPIANDDEMGLPLDDAVARLAGNATWQAAFEAAVGRGPDREGLAAALAAFVRSQLIGDSPVDRFRTGDFAALDDSARQGLWLFESKGGCWRCHSGPNFSDEGFHATGIGAVDGRAEDGRLAVTGDADDRGRFKTPTLRGLTRTAPYMHDGGLATLRDVVDYYSRGGNAVPERDPRLARLDLSEDEKASLVAFLEALSAPAER